jgi:arginase family enzyme
LLGVPYDASSSYLRGAAAAPAKIREALRSPSSNGWSESGVDILAEGVLADAGDVTMPDIGEARAAIEASVRHLYDEFEGDRFSHACPFARIMEERLASRLVQVGIRAATQHQRDQAKKFNVDVIDMKVWESGRRPKAGGPTYLSLDLDGLDPAFAPGVSHPEPGGLSVRDVVNVIQSLQGPIIGADIVELNPSRDVNGLTAMVAAKFVKEIAARMLESS